MTIYVKNRKSINFYWQNKSINKKIKNLKAWDEGFDLSKLDMKDSIYQDIAEIVNYSFAYTQLKFFKS